jgi:Tfp pilus assembly protein PilF
MKTLAILYASILLAGCASAPPVPPPSDLYADARFAAPSEHIGTEDLFTLSPEMRDYLRTELAAQSHQNEIQRRLFDALYKKGELKIDYDSARTRTASQAFAARAGNCLSLAIMTAAFAKEAGLDTYFQSVVVDNSWSRTGKLYFGSGHVNVVLGAKLTEPPRFPRGDQRNSVFTVDFLPAEDAARRDTDIIEEQDIAAMFMNNRAAEALGGGRIDDAYWWARQDIAQHPTFLPAYNTLGVIYYRHGDTALAERAFRFMLARDPKNTVSMSNLIPVLRAQGKTEQAQQLASLFASLEPHPAFQAFNDGMAAMRKGDYGNARDYFIKEVKRDPYYHEFHFWLAQAYYRLGENKRADAELALAIDTSTTRKDKSLYAAKLERLRSIN